MKIDSNLPFRRESINKEQKLTTVNKSSKEQKISKFESDTLDLSGAENKEVNDRVQIYQDTTDNAQTFNNLSKYITQSNINNPSEAKELLKLTKENILKSPDQTIDSQSSHSPSEVLRLLI